MKESAEGIASPWTPTQSRESPEEFGGPGGIRSVIAARCGFRIEGSYLRGSATTHQRVAVAFWYRPNQVTPSTLSLAGLGTLAYLMALRFTDFFVPLVSPGPPSMPYLCPEVSCLSLPTGTVSQQGCRVSRRRWPCSCLYCQTSHLFPPVFRGSFEGIPHPSLFVLRRTLLRMPPSRAPALCSLEDLECYPEVTLAVSYNTPRPLDRNYQSR